MPEPTLTNVESALAAGKAELMALRLARLVFPDSLRLALDAAALVEVLAEVEARRDDLECAELLAWLDLADPPTIHRG